MKRGEREAFTIYIHSPKGPLLTTVAVDKAQQVDDHGDDEEVGGQSYHPYNPVTRVETEDGFHV